STSHSPVTLAARCGTPRKAENSDGPVLALGDVTSVTPAARRAYAPAIARGAGGAGAPTRPGPPPRAGGGGESAPIPPLLGTPWDRQDHGRATPRPHPGRGVGRAVGGVGRSEGRAGGRGRCRGAPRSVRPPHAPLHRRDPPLLESAAGRAAPARRGGHLD